MAKKITFDIVGNDRGATRAFDKVGGAAKRLQGNLGRLGGGARSVLKPIAAVSSAGATLTSVAGPAAAGVAKLATAGAHLALTLAPLAATVPALAGGFVLLKQTVIATGPAMAKALDPVKKAFVDNQKEVDKLATRGLPKLAQGFLKVNFPTIAAGMARIARAQNRVVVGVGKWINSANGQKAIKTIVVGTAKAAEQLAPKITALAISFGNLVARAGDGAISRFGTGLGLAADQAKRLLDSVSVSDIQAAWKEFDRLAGVVAGLPDKFRQLQGALQTATKFWRDNQEAIAGVHLALTGVAVVAGALTGNWFPALAAAGSLVVTNWSGVTAVASQVAGWFARTAASASTLGEIFRGVAAAGQQWGHTFMAAGRQIGPLLEPLMKDLSELGSQLGESLRLSMPAIRVFGTVLLKVLGGAIATLVVAADAATKTATVMTFAFNFAAKGIAYAIKGILNFISTLIGGVGNLLASIPGPFAEMGRSLQRAAADVRRQANEIQGYIDGVHGKTVNIDVVTNYKTGKGTPSGPLKVGYRAAGGPMEAGHPYVVGETGPELIVPGSKATVLSAAKTKALTARPRALVSGAGGGGNTHIYLHNNGVIGSRAEVDSWLAGALDRLSNHGRLPGRLRRA